MTRASGTNRRHANPARRSDTKADKKGRPKPSRSSSVLRGGYGGFCPLETGAGISGGGGRVERKHWTELNPQDFFESYVKARKPLVISTDGVSGGALGMLFGLQGEAAKWSLPGLQGMKAMRSSGAANCEVFVERRPEKSSLFGQSDDVSREKTTFGDFCRELESGNELAYLTTQALEDADGCPKSLAADHVLKLLTGCQSLRPNLIGNLTPVQYNMWFGRSSEGSSSGLHHDFHDNIYVLLRGRKEFRLFSPRCLDVLAPAGLRQAQLHSNGLISYVPGLRDDGAPTVSVRDWREGAKQGSSVNQQPSMNDSSEDEELEQMLNDVLSADIDAGSDQPEQGSLPDSFCRASTMSRSAPIPKILEGRHITADLGVGDLLYLPASWFHEVISYGGDSGGHLALNLWMAPPHWGSTWQAPYEDGFWESFFQRLNPMPSAPQKSFAKVRKSKRLPFTHAARLPRRIKNPAIE